MSVEQTAPVVPPQPGNNTNERGTLLQGLQDLESKPETTSEPAAEVSTEPAAEVEQPAKAAPTESVEADKVDPEVAKRLDQIQKASKREREIVAKERAELEELRKSIEPALESSKRFQELSKRAKYDPAGVLLSLGLTSDDLELAARHVYSQSKAAEADPKHKEQSAKLLREREYEDKLKATESRLQELESKLSQERESERINREAERYLESVTKAINQDTPLVNTLMSKSPEKARQRLSEVAQYLIEQTGEVPDPEEVAQTLEKLRMSELEELGIDPSTVLKTAPKTQNPAAAETKAAKQTLSNDLTNTVSPRSAPKDPREERIALIRALESGQLK